MSSELQSQISTAIANIGLSTHDELLVGLSGGADSLTLAHSLWTLHLEGSGPRPYAVHIDHGLRPGSSADARQVVSIAGEIGLPVEIIEADVERWRRERGQGIEAAARSARYAAFSTVATQRGIEWLALGHTRDDQVETVLLRLWRGASLDGLAGMRRISERSVPLSPEGDQHTRLRVVRPLLDTSRAEIDAYVTEARLRPVEDPSNASLQFRRNVIRHQILPVMERESLGSKSAIARTVDLLRDDADFINEAVDRVASQVLEEANGLVLIKRNAFRECHVVVQRRLLARVLYRLAGDLAQPTRERIDALRGMVQLGEVSSRLELGGDLLALTDYEIVAAGSSDALEPTLRALTGLPLLTPGSEIGVVDSVTLRLGNSWCLDITVPSGMFRVTVRTRKPGDRFEPQTGHRVRLQDLLVNRKVPAYVRDWLPLVVVDSSVRWIGGVSPGEYRDVDCGLTISLGQATA